MGRNTTGPPCSIGHPRAAGAPTVHTAGSWPTCTPTALQMTTDASQQNNAGPLGGPVISQLLQLMFVK